MRRRVARASRSTCERAEVGVDLDARAAGRGRARRSRRCRTPGPCAPPGRRAAARPGTPLWRATSMRRSSAASGSCAARGHVLVVGVHPQLAAGALDDRRGLAVVVGVRVRADEQLHVLDPQVRPAPARARGARTSPARASRCRTGRSRRPAAIAQALQCGTPGQGSGRRRRQTPGSTRSPRPSSRLRVGSGIELQPSGSLRRRRRSTRSQA